MGQWMGILKDEVDHCYMRKARVEDGTGIKIGSTVMAQMVLISVVVRLATGVLELIFLYFMTFLRKKNVILKDAAPITIIPAVVEDRKAEA